MALLPDGPAAKLGGTGPARARNRSPRAPPGAAYVSLGHAASPSSSTWRKIPLPAHAVDRTAVRRLATSPEGGHTVVKAAVFRSWARLAISAKQARLRSGQPARVLGCPPRRALAWSFDPKGTARSSPLLCQPSASSAGPIVPGSRRGWGSRPTGGALSQGLCVVIVMFQLEYLLSLGLALPDSMSRNTSARAWRPEPGPGLPPQRWPHSASTLLRPPSSAASIIRSIRSRVSRRVFHGPDRAETEIIRIFRWDVSLPPFIKI